MNNKIIAAGVVVALCAVALIGVGYAYTATVTNSNSVVSEYVVLNINDGSGNAESLFSTNKVDFSTSTTTTGTVWWAGKIQTVGSDESQALRITANGIENNTPITLSLTVNGLDNDAESKLLGNGAKISFTNNTDTIIFTNNGSEWESTGSFKIGSSYTASITTVAIPKESAVSSAPEISFTMELKYTSAGHDPAFDN